jgi:hypothetical protein
LLVAISVVWIAAFARVDHEATVLDSLHEGMTFLEVMDVLHPGVVYADEESPPELFEGSILFIDELPDTFPFAPSGIHLKFEGRPRRLAEMTLVKPSAKATFSYWWLKIRSKF